MSTAPGNPREGAPRSWSKIPTIQVICRGFCWDCYICVQNCQPSLSWIVLCIPAESPQEHKHTASSFWEHHFGRPFFGPFNPDQSLCTPILSQHTFHHSNLQNPKQLMDTDFKHSRFQGFPWKEPLLPQQDTEPSSQLQTQPGTHPTPQNV